MQEKLEKNFVVSSNFLVHEKVTKMIREEFFKILIRSNSCQEKKY